eukprot:2952759-Rhodomonas_salina.1
MQVLHRVLGVQRRSDDVAQAPEVQAADVPAPARQGAGHPWHRPGGLRSVCVHMYSSALLSGVRAVCGLCASDACDDAVRAALLPVLHLQRGGRTGLGRHWLRLFLRCCRLLRAP